MRKATAIYHAIEGNNKVAEWNGVTFFDGQPVELNTDDHDHMINKMKNNRFFEIEVSADDEKPKRGPGRPSNAEKAAESAKDEKLSEAVT